MKKEFMMNIEEQIEELRLQLIDTSSINRCR